MYSTKIFHKSMVHDNAYLHKGDTYHDPVQNPFRQGTKPVKGKSENEKVPAPFKTALVARNAENGNFAKLTYVPPRAKLTKLDPGEREDLPDVIKYITVEPLDKRKTGFGTHDASRRDEFSNNIRTEQYRETLYKEKRLNSENADQLQEKLQKLLEERAKSTVSPTSSTEGDSLFNYSQRVRQYDIGRNRITAFDPRSTKDAYYKFEHERPKRFGELQKPVSCDIGDAAWDITYKPPAHGGRSEVKNFYDKSHLNVTTY